MKKQIVILILCGLMLALGTISVGQPLAAKANSSTESIVPNTTTTVFTEGFEGAFPGTSWYVTDWTATNGYDYWDDTTYRAHSGSWSGWCAQVGTHTTTVTVFTEDFEGAFPGTAWTVGDWSGTSGYDYWDDTSYRAYSGYWSGWCAQIGNQATFPYSANSAVHKYDNYMDAYMYRYVNLAGQTSATLMYRYWLDCESGYDYFAAMYYDSIEGWIITNAKSGRYASSGWQYTSVNIPVSTHYVGFKFHSDGSVIYEGAYVDSISLTATGTVNNYADHLYDNYMDSVMYRAVSLSGYSSASLSYWYWLDCESGYDYLQVMYWSANAWHYLDTHTGHYGYWQYSSVSIPTYAQYVGFRFHSDVSVTDYGAYLDDIVCTGTTAPPSEIIVDNPAAVFVGTWPSSTSVAGYYGSNYQYHAAGTGANTGTWSFSIPTAGSWQVYAWWTINPNRATNAPYTVYYAGGSATVTKNQQINGGSWQLLGTFTYNVGTYSVRLTDNANGFVIADAIRLVPGAAPTEIIVDNPAAVFVGTWPSSTSVAGYYGSNYQYHAAGTGANTGTWSFSIPTAGSWQVYAWWTINPNRATNAPYTVYYAGGSATVTKNQQINGGSWQLLGTFTYNVGTYSVRLTDNANGFVIADAIRLVHT